MGDRRAFSLAIVGIGCRFPGRADSPAQFWENLCKGVDAICEVPRERFDIDRVYDPDPARPGKLYIRRAGFIENAGRFDAAFFHVSPREAAQMDPQQRLLLEVAWEAMEDAGQALPRLAGSRTGVFIGVSTHDFGDLNAGPLNRSNIGPHTATGAATSLIANRLSYAFDFRGPSLAVDTACSSSLTAVHLACRSLLDGESDLALAGGVNLFLSPDSAIGLAKASMLSPDGVCRAFDSGANGFVRGEGAGVVVLRRLADAVRDRDRVYAVIRGTAVNQDGHTASITMPRVEAQEALIETALGVAGIDRGSVRYLEAHGTGTVVGDPIEAQAIGRVFARGRQPERPLYVGSVKTSIGHLEAAAGVASLVKTALVLQHRSIVPNLNFVDPNPAIPFTDLRLEVPVAPTPWPDPAAPAIAGVNSFGFGGANAHVLLEEAAAPADQAVDSGDRPRVLTLSAASAAALRERCRSLGALIASGTANLDDVCHTAAVRRTHLEHRVAIVGASRDDMVAGLNSVVDGAQSRDVVASRAARGRPPKLALVFSGMGPSLAGCAAELVGCEPVFRATIERCDAALVPLAGWSVAAALTDASAASKVPEAMLAQVGNYALQAALVDLLRAWQITGEAVVGHSNGEIAAAYAAGALTLEEGLTLVFHRGRLVQRTSGTGRLLAAEVSADEARALAARWEGRVSVAAFNSGTAVTLSGDEGPLREIEAELTRRQVFCRLLDVNVPYHSPALDRLRDEFVSSAVGIAQRPPSLRFASSVLGDWMDGAALDAEYWWKTIREPVRFAEAVGALDRAGFDTYLQVGPHPVLRTYLSSGLGAGATILPTLHRSEPHAAGLLRSVATLHVKGVAVDWNAVLGGRGRCVSLPTYPWQREDFGTGKELADGARQAPGGIDSGHPLLGVRLPTARPAWQASLDGPPLAYLGDHRLQGAAVFPAAGYVEAALAAAVQMREGTHAAIERMGFEKMLVLREPRGVQLQLTCDADGAFEIHARQGPSEIEWVRHAHGKIVPEAGGAQARPAVDLGAIRARCLQERSPSDLYDSLARRGLEYSGTFRTISRAWQGRSEALGQLVAPAADARAYLVHPAVLDGALQLLIAAQASGPTAAADGIFLPASIAHVDWCAGGGRELWAHAALRRVSRTEIEGDVRLFDEDGRVFVGLTGLRAVRVGTVTDTGRSALCLHELQWKEWPGSTVDRLELPTPAEVAGALAAFGREAAASGAGTAYDDEVARDLNLLAAAYARSALTDLGCEVSGDGGSPLAAMQRAGLDERHRRFFVRLSEVAVLVPAHPDRDRLRDRVTAVTTRHPEWSDVVDLIARAGEALCDVLRGAREAQAVLFSGAAGEALTRLYSDSPPLTYANRVLAAAVAHAARRVDDTRPLRVLEIGAGTGGATAAIFAAAHDRLAYTFTDVSPFFLAQARQRFADRPDLTFGLLDIEKAESARSLPFQQYDVVVASNVFHGTADLRTTLRNARRLLSPGGLLVMLELARPEPWADLIFGLFEGWWRFADSDLRPAHASMDRERWLSLLAESGFESPEALPDLEGDLHPLHTVIVARRSASHGPPMPSAPPAERPVWLAVGGGRPRAGRLLAALERHGCAAIHVDRLAAAPTRDVAGIVWLGALEAPSIEGMTAAALVSQAAQALGALGRCVRWVMEDDGARPQLWIVTADTQEAVEQGGRGAPLQSPFWPVGRVVVEEYPSLTCRLADVSADATDDELDALAETIASNPDEEEFLFRGTRRWVPRLARIPDGRLEAAVRTDPVDGVDDVRVEIDIPGELDTLGLRAARNTPLADDEVRVRVRSAGLNFKDVMHALGLLPFPADDPRADSARPLGFECAGTIIEVGRGVGGLGVGDEVCGIGSGTMGRVARIPAHLAFRVPPGLSLDDAGGVLVAFATALHCLRHLARVEPGERVLVHSAAGGVGLAAVQICRNLGAEVFATAGTPEKRDYLRSAGVTHVMDSRSLDFADRVGEITGGEGVDVVLNSLAGPAIERSLALLRPFGRFLEIGKRDLVQNTPIGLAPFEKHLAFFSVDLDRIRTLKPDVFAALCREVLAEFEAGRLQPLPRTDVEMSDAPVAFRTMAHGRHIGKIVLTSHRDAPVALPSRAQFLFSAHATYLITGGLGGFGLAMARWMLDHGARHIVLTGRTDTPREGNRAALDELKATGADVVVMPADVGSEEQVAGVLGRIRETLPPLRGVFHLAVVLEDRQLTLLDADDWKRVLDPKMAGAWNLHRLTSDLDYFVMFSSATSILGNVGQARYAAGNAFLDALARDRRASGLPAVSVGWGLIGDVGIVADRLDLRRYFDRIGLEPMAVAEALDVLERILRSKVGYAAPFRMAWSRFASWNRSTPRRLSDLLAEAADTGRAGSSSLDSGVAPTDGPAPSGVDAVETRARKHVAAVLGRAATAIDPDVPLTDLGLDSLMAVELESILRRDLGLQVTAVRLLQRISLRQVLDAAAAADDSVRASQPTATPPTDIVRLPLAPTQRRFWFLQQVDPSSVAYNMPMIIRLTGELDRPALERAINEVVKRQDALRATFSVAGGEVVQRIAPTLTVPLPVIDIASEADCEGTLARLAREEAGRVFDLATGPLMTTRLVRLGPREHVLLATAHHLVVDAWSAGVLTRQTAAWYRCFVGASPPPDDTTTSYGEAIRRLLTTVADREDEDLRYWHTQLRNVRPLRRLDGAHAARPTGRTTRIAFDLPGDLLASVAALAKSEGTTPFAVLLTVYALLLARRSRTGDVCVGTPVFSRVDQEERGLVGCLVNTLAVRVRLAAGMSFRECLRDTWNTVLDATEHQHVPWDRVVEHVNPPREPGRLPVFQALFVYHSFPLADADMPGLTLDWSLTDVGASPFELTLIVDSARRRVSIDFDRMYDGGLVRGFIDAYLQTLADSVAEPGRVVTAGLESGMDAADQPGDGPHDAGQAAGTVHALFEAQASRSPDAVAIEAEAGRMTYRQLARAARRLAVRLQAEGLGVGSHVAIALRRSPNAVVAMLGVLEAGAAFVPVDVQVPAARLRAMLHDAHVALIVTDAELAPRCPDVAPVLVLNHEWADADVDPAGEGTPVRPARSAGASDLAYVMYTSGSTGRPKGVMVEHASLVHQIAWRQSEFPLTRDDVVLHSTALTFDPSMWEIFGPLSVGARAVIVDGPAQDGRTVGSLIRAHRVTAVQGVPSLIRSWLAQGAFDGSGTVRYAFCGGESLDASLRRRMVDEVGATLVNLYGCTETTIDASFYRCRGDERAGGTPIGRPVAHTRLHVLDGGGKPVPDGVAGELYVAGPGVARGYLNDLPLTERRFVPDPLDGRNGGRAFRTGDIVRRLPGGDLEFLGRADRQLKVRGHRVEPDEIEEVLRRHADVQDAVVAVRPGPGGDGRLVAWVATAGQDGGLVEQLRTAVAEAVPDYMVPSRFVTVAALPRLSSGKVDLASLSDADETDRHALVGSTDQQRVLVHLWEQMLGVRGIGIDDDFFALGGHSLLAVHAAQRMSETLGREVRCVDVMSGSTIRRILSNGRPDPAAAGGPFGGG